jgi:hypothetical protein
MGIVLYGLMLLLAAVMVYAMIQAKAGAAWAKPAAGGSAALGLMLALMTVITSLSGCGDGTAEAAAYDRTMQETTYAFEGFGKTIATDFSGSKAMLVTLETTDVEHLKLVQDALTAGLGTSVEIVHAWTPEPADPASGSLGYDAKTLDEEFTASGADLLISLLGLPSDFHDLALMRADPVTKVAVMNARPDLNLKQLMQRNLVQLAVIPNASYKQTASDPDAETFFSARFLIVRPKSLAEQQGAFR